MSTLATYKVSQQQIGHLYKERLMCHRQLHSSNCCVILLQKSALCAEGPKGGLSQHRGKKVWTCSSARALSARLLPGGGKGGAACCGDSAARASAAAVAAAEVAVLLPRGAGNGTSTSACARQHDTRIVHATLAACLLTKEKHIRSSTGCTSCTTETH